MRRVHPPHPSRPPSVSWSHSKVVITPSGLRGLSRISANPDARALIRYCPDITIAMIAERSIIRRCLSPLPPLFIYFALLRPALVPYWKTPGVQSFGAHRHLGRSVVAGQEHLERGGRVRDQGERCPPVYSAGGRQRLHRTGGCPAPGSRRAACLRRPVEAARASLWMVLPSCFLASGRGRESGHDDECLLGRCRSSCACYED